MNTTPVGLDIGTSRIVLARRIENAFQFESQLNAFTTIPHSKVTEGVLKKQHIPHKVDGEQIIVYGDEAETFADLFHVETRRPMLKGVLNPNEPDGHALIRAMIEHLAGEDERKGRKLWFSVPAPPLGSDETAAYHESALRTILVELGYEVKSINEGIAVIYSELEDTNYTGIGISCGGGMCNVALAYLSVPVISFSVTKAGDFVDLSAAAATGEIATRIRILKEQSFKLNGASSDRICQALGIYYDEMVRNLVKAMQEAFSNAKNMPKLRRPVPIVLSGGTVMPAGFADRFEKLLRESDFPLPISEIRLAPDPLNATARGAALAALAEV